MFNWLKRKFLEIITTKNISPHKLARSWALGSYIAFSPFPGIHKLMLLGVQYLFNTHFPFLLMGCYSINNPWTMIPVYLGDYYFGHWIVHGIFGYTDLWELSLESIGLGKVCMLSFFVGGNILEIAASLVSYPIILRLARKYHDKHTEEEHHEDHPTGSA